MSFQNLLSWLPVEPVRSTTKERIETVRFGNGILAGIWVEEILKTKNYVRESKWSQSIAIGSKSFVEGIKEKLGIRAKSRKVGESGGLYHLREAQVPYNSDFTPENSGLRAKNTYFLFIYRLASEFP